MIAVRRSLWLLLAALFIPLCILPVQPFVTSGINDDWSYMHTAHVLFLTGHVAYNGWAAPMLGWQLYLSDLLFHLFGFSYTAMRMGTVLVSAVLTVVVHRIFVRCGVRERYAYLATFTLIASPLFMPLAFSYMTDVYGLFSLCLCLLLCMEAILAETDMVALVLLSAAMVTNAFTGTARQVAWLGVLVLCPCAMWLLRRRSRVIVPATAVLLACWAFVGWCMHWFSAQSFVPRESSLEGVLKKEALLWLAKMLVQVPLETCVLCLPVLMLFAVALLPIYRKVLIGAGVAFAVVAYVAETIPVSALLHARLERYLLFPYLQNYVSVHGAADGTYLPGAQPVILTPLVRIVWTALALTCAASLLFSLRSDSPVCVDEEPAGVLSWHRVNVLVLPLFLAYVILHLPRAMRGEGVFDRYLLFVTVIVMIYALRWYQARGTAHSTWPSWVLLILIAGYSLATTHDLFALHRARVGAIKELLDAHIDPVAIDGGLEFNGIIQIEHTGYVFGPRLDQTRGMVDAPVEEGRDNCIPQFSRMLPMVQPRYAVSFTAAMCGGAAPFAPVFYHAWLGQHRVPLYILNVAHAGPDTPQEGETWPH